AARENWEAILGAKEGRAPAQARLLHALARGAPVSRKRLLSEGRASESALRALIEQGLVERVAGGFEEAAASLEPPTGRLGEPLALASLPPLTPEQAEAVKRIGDAVRRGRGARPI